MPDLLTDEGLPFVLRCTRPSGEVHTLASDNWRTILPSLYVLAATICDELGFTSLERGNVFADLPGGLEPPQAVNFDFSGFGVAWIINVEVRS